MAETRPTRAIRPVTRRVIPPDASSMKSRPHTPILLCGLVTSIFVAAVLVRAEDKPKANKPAPVDYATQIKPIFAEHCHDCHSAAEHKSGFRIDTASLAIRGG